MAHIKTIDIFGNFVDKNCPYLHLILALDRDPRIRINILGPVHSSLLHIQKRPYIKGSIALGLGTPRDIQGMHMGDYDLKLGYTSWETNKVPYGSSYGLKNILKKLDLLIVPDYWQYTLFEHVGVPMSVIPVAASLPITPRRKRGDRYTFLCVGRLTYKTNVGYLISAATALARKYNIELILKTDGGTLGHLQFPEDTIKIIDGDLSTEELQKLYSNADCFVYPTSADDMPIPLFDAIQHGLRVIAPTHSGFDDQNDLRKHELVPAKRYSKKLGDVGSYWSIDYEELYAAMEDSINGINPYYGSNTLYQTTAGFVNDIIKLIKGI